MKIAIFSLQKFVIYNMITDSFLVEKWGRNIRACKEVRLKMKNRLGRVFPSHFLQNILIETSNVSYLVLFHFLMPWSLKIQERNHQLTWPLMILFQGITRLKGIWMLKFQHIFFHRSSCAKNGDFASARVIWIQFQENLRRKFEKNSQH